MLQSARPGSEVPDQAEPALNAEIIYFHTDRDKYIAGESVWFSIYTVFSETGRLSPGSRIAYIELISPRNTPVIQSRYELSGGRGEGAFVLPDSLSSGTYLVRAYTNLMKNSLPEYCFMQEIDVYNPFRGSEFLLRRNQIDPSGVQNTLIDNIIQLSVDTVYGTRQKVTAGIKVSGGGLSRSGFAEMSVSVIPADLNIPARMISKSPPSDMDSAVRYQQEIDGHYLSFLVRYRNGNKADSSDFLFMSIQGKVAEFNYAPRGDDGRFTFILPVDSKSRNLVIQPEFAAGSMILEADPPFSGILPEPGCHRVEMDERQNSLFSQLSFNYQASRIYGTIISHAEETYEDKESSRRRFYGIPEMEIVLDDYIRLPNIQEIFFELVPGVIIRSGRTGYEIKITNPLTGSFYLEPPLVMIDGVIINDLAALIDLDPDIVERIEVVKTPYLFGDMILHGIVNVITREGNFSDITMPEYAVILPYRVVEKPPQFTAPGYSDELKRLSRTPDLRNTLYWNPSVRTDSRGEAEVEFWTSDLPGSYNIIVNGVTGSGDRISVHRTFRIK